MTAECIDTVLILDFLANYPTTGKTAREKLSDKKEQEHKKKWR